jgi:hypothetical protein
MDGSSLNKIGVPKKLPLTCAISPFSLNVVQTNPTDFVVFTMDSNCRGLPVNQVLTNGSIIKQTYTINFFANIHTVLANPATKGFTVIYDGPSPNGSPALARLDQNFVLEEKSVRLACRSSFLGSSLLYNSVTKQYLALWTGSTTPGTGANIAAQRIRLKPLGSGCQ